MLPLFAIYLIWTVWFVARIVAALAPKPPRPQLTIVEALLYRLTALVATCLLFTVTPWPGIDLQYRLWERGIDDDLAWQLIGGVALALGFSGWALAKRLSTWRQGRIHATTGPYAALRHPIYLGLICAAVLTAVEFGRPSSFLGATLLSAGFVLKALREEQRDNSHVFATYRQRVAMFVPFLGFVRNLFRPAPPLVRSKEPVMPNIATVPLDLTLDEDEHTPHAA